MWVQVTLPSPITCSQTAIVGWSGSHSPSNNAYVQASNDGVTWTELARWDVHPGGSETYLRTTFAGYGGNLDENMNTYGIDLTLTGTAYQYYRAGGDKGFSNGWQIVQRWVLMCSAPQ